MRKLRFYQLHSVRFAPCGCPFPLEEKCLVLKWIYTKIGQKNGGKSKIKTEA